MWGVVGSTVVAVALVFALGWGSMAVALFRRIPFLIAFAKAIRDLVAHRGRLSVSLLASVGYAVLVGVTAWIIALAIDVDISLTTATLLIMGTTFFATAVPSAPSAIGTWEFAVIYGLKFFGVEQEAGFGFAVIIHAVLFLPPMIIAAVFLPREGIGTVRRFRGLSARRAGAGNGTVA